MGEGEGRIIFSPVILILFGKYTQKVGQKGLKFRVLNSDRELNLKGGGQIAEMTEAAVKSVFHSCDQQPFIFAGTNESVHTRKECGS